MRRAIAALLLAATLPGCAILPKTVRPAQGPQLPAQFVPYDLRPLLWPPNAFFGVSFGGAPASTQPFADLGGQVGKNPNLAMFYLGFGEELPTDIVNRLWQSGMLPFVTWEPFKVSLATISSGAYDGYLRHFAERVRDLNLPVALSFGHEMNGTWYPWGAQQNKPSDFVRAWRHVRKIFQDTGAVDVLWVWSPNIVTPKSPSRLDRYYPGDSQVDWIGVIGYYRSGGVTYDQVFVPTMQKIRKFTRKPFILAETAVAAGPDKAAGISDLLHRVAGDHQVIGLVWFDLEKESEKSDWRIESSAPALKAFRKGIADPRYGFALH